MNFNFNNQPEYQLHNDLTRELINLYGVPTKFLITEKINYDSTVFGDFSHIKTNGADIFDIFMLPEITEDWTETNYAFNNGYFNNFDTVNMFVSKSDFADIVKDELDEIVGNLVILPNNKIMEVTHANITVPGVNNLFTYDNAKNVYMLSLKPLDNKIINELDNVDISVDDMGQPYETLDTYFAELLDQAQDVEDEAEVIPSVDTVEKETGIDGTDTIVQKPIVDDDEDDVWGKY